MSHDAPLRLEPDAACDACGEFGAFRFDGETLCADCYAGRGSCCSAEFSGGSGGHRPRDPASETEAPRATRCARDAPPTAS